MAEPTIKNGEEHFWTNLYEGNGAGQRVGKFVPFTDNGTIANSVIYNRTDNPRLAITPSSAGNRRTWTFSAWIKRTILGSPRHQILNVSPSDGASGDFLYFDTNNTIKFTDATSSNYTLITNRTFEDTSKFYHLLISADSTQSTAANRLKIYIDGEQITSFSTETYMAQDYQFEVNNNSLVMNLFGDFGSSNTENGDGYFAEVNMVDGTALTPSTFGLTDTSTGRWIPKTLTGITYGTNGFRLQFLDSTHAGIDTSGNGNTFTASNLIDFESQPIAMGGTAFNTGSAGAWDGSYPVANGFTESTSTQAIYNDGSTAIGGVIGWDFGSGRSANIQHIKINQIAVNNSITGFAFEYSDNGSDYTSVGTFSVTASTSEQTVSVTNTAGKHRYWRLRATTDTSGGQNAYRWVVAFLGFFSEPITTDSPTQNHTTLSSSRTRGSLTLSEGNLKMTCTSTNYAASATTFRFSEKASTGLYFEVKNAGSAQDAMSVLIMRNSVAVSGLGSNQQFTDCFGLISRGGGGSNQYWLSNNGSNDVTTGVSHASNDYIQVAFKDGKVWYGINNTWIFSGNPATGANPTYDNISGQDFRFLMTGYNNHILECNFGQRAFRYTPPTDFVAVQQDNLPETAKGVSDLVIIKNRDATDSWVWQDSLRGAGEYGSTATATQYNTAITDGVQKFLKGGVQIEDNDAVNTSGESYVAYCWNINGGTKTTDTSGDLSVELQANATAGVSIGKFTVSGSGNRTWAHGLSGVPEMGILQVYGATTYGTTYHHEFSTTPYSSGAFLTTDAAAFTSSNIWGSAKPTSTLWTGLVGSLFSASSTYVFYSFRGIEGFSKFGKYLGNASTDGPFIYTGFKSAYVMVKNASVSGTWVIWDNKRTPINPMGIGLRADTTAADTTGYDIDFLSNGFKIRDSESSVNGSGNTIIYMAFAEHPFVGDGTNPVTAR